MAYQPKSYRKFLATSVSAAMVATTFGAVAPVNVQQADAAESFSDVHDTYWASDSIQRLADQGIIHGYPDGTYRPGQTITRAQVAELFTHAFNLPVDEDATSPYNDLNDDSYATPFAVAVTEAGIMQGRENGTEFAPGMELQRQQMATMLVRAFDLEPVEGEEANVVDLEDAHESHRENIEILSQYNITSTTDGKFRPKETVTRAQFAVFLDRALEVAKPTEILEVNALTDDGHVLEVKFSSPYRGEINRSDVRVFETESLARKGVERIELSSDRMSLEVHLFDNTSEDAPPEVPRLVEHTIQIGDLTHNFTRPGFIKHRVIEVDVHDRDITVLTDNGTTRTIEVPEEFGDLNLFELLGEEVSVWFNKDDELVDYNIERATADYDAIEITKEDEIKLLTEDEKFDVSDDQFDNVNEDQFRFYVNGEEEDIEDFVDRKFNFAKVGYDKSGDVVFVSAYNLSNFLVVDRVEDDEVIGYAGEGTGGSFDAKDATIVKDGQSISLDDLEQGDVLFFNPDANGDDGFAEVYNNEVQGEIEDVYNESIRVNGEIYDFVYDSADIEDFQVEYEGGAVYLNEDGETEYIDSDAAEKLQAAGEVVLHLDRAGNLIYIDGDLADVESNTKPSVLTDDVKFDTNFGRDLAQFEVVTSDGDERLYQVQLDRLDTITVNGVEYEIDDAEDRDDDEWAPSVENGEIVLTSGDGETFTVDAEALQEGQLIQLHLDDNENIEEIDFFTANDTEEGTDVLDEDEVLEAGDTYFNGTNGAKRLVNDTVVFDAKRGTDPDDITVTTWGEYNGSSIDDATVIYNDDDEAIAIVIHSTTTVDIVYEEAVITRVLRNTDEEVVEIRAFVNGEEQTFEVNDVDVDLSRGDVAVLEFDDSNLDLVEDIHVSGSQYEDRIIVGDVDRVDVGKREVTIDGTVYRLVSDGAVIDVSDPSDITEEALRDLRGEENVTVVLDETSGRFAKFFVIGADVDDDEDSDELTVTVDDATATEGDEEVEVTYTVANAEEALDIDFAVENADGATIGEATVEDAEDGEGTVTIELDEALVAGEEYTITASVDGEEVADAVLEVVEEDENNMGTVAENNGTVADGVIMMAVAIPAGDNLDPSENYVLLIDGNKYALEYNEEQSRFEASLSPQLDKDKIENATIMRVTE